MPAFCRVAGIDQAIGRLRHRVRSLDARLRIGMASSKESAMAASRARSATAALRTPWRTATPPPPPTPAIMPAAPTQRWALDHPEKITDFGYRAIHETAVKAKAIIHAFYGEDPSGPTSAPAPTAAARRSWRRSAIRPITTASSPAHPQLLDASALTRDWDIWRCWRSGQLYSGAASCRHPSRRAGRLRRARRREGRRDRRSHRAAISIPSTLLCQGAETDSVPDRAAIDALEKLYAGGRNSKGQQIFPGYSPGGEAEHGGWGRWITGSSPEKVSVRLRHAVL